MTTFNEWAAQAKVLLPSVGQLAVDGGLFFNSEAAGRLLDEGEYPTVFAMILSLLDGLESAPHDVLQLVADYPYEERH